MTRPQQSPSNWLRSLIWLVHVADTEPTLLFMPRFEIPVLRVTFMCHKKKKEIRWICGVSFGRGSFVTGKEAKKCDELHLRRYSRIIPGRSFTSTALVCDQTGP